MTNIALQIAGVCAIFIALYHGIVGDGIVQAMQIEPKEQKPLMRGSFHIGTMGWLVGGCVILLVSMLEGGFVRSAVVIAYAILFGIPALGQIVMSKGRPNFGMIVLILIVILLLIGR